MQNVREILLGEHGLAGVQALLVGDPAQEMLRRMLAGMLDEGCRLGALRLQRAKFKPARKLVAYYDLAVYTDAGDGGTGSLSRGIAVTWSIAAAAAPEPTAPAFPFGRLAAAVPRCTDGVSWGLQIAVSPHDAAYPQLRRLVDPAYVRTLVGTYAAPPAGAYVVSTVRYRPGQRHVLRYSPARGDPGGDPAHGGAGSLFAKLYAPARYAAARGQAFCALTHRLADWVESCVPGATVLRPAAYVAEDTSTLYPWVPGVPLAELQGCGELNGGLIRALKVTGSALAALHAAPPAVTGELPRQELAGEIAAIAKTCEHIEVLLPAAGRTIRGLLGQAAGTYAALPQEAAAFIHGDFKADHVLVEVTGRLTLIDFDSCGLGDPAYDIGKFLADLAWAYAACPPCDLLVARAAFLGGYGLPEGHPRQQRAQVVAALILVKIAAHRVKLFDPTWEAQTLALVAQAQMLLA